MARKSAKSTRLAGQARPSWACLGFDTSLSALAGVAFGYDGPLDKYKGPTVFTERWNEGQHYFDKMKFLARGENAVLDLLAGLNMNIATDDIHIGIEEPFPLGMAKRMESSYIKQQAQVHGAFLGALLRYGFVNVYEVNNQRWKTAAIDDGAPQALRKDKWEVKLWAMSAYGLPDLPDLINRKGGKVPRPEGSVAKAIQPEDVYDACGVLNWVRAEAGLD